MYLLKKKLKKTISLKKRFKNYLFAKEQKILKNIYLCKIIITVKKN